MNEFGDLAMCLSAHECENRNLKKLGEFTMQEIKNICIFYHRCEDCPLNDRDRCYLSNLPEDWNVARSITRRLLTPDEITAARILHHTASVVSITRDKSGLFAKTRDGVRINLSYDSFLSINFGDTLEVEGI